MTIAPSVERRIVALKSADPSLTNRQIATVANTSPGTVQRVLKIRKPVRRPHAGQDADERGKW